MKISIKGHDINVYVASDQVSRQMGFRGKDAPGPDEGLLFIWQSSKQRFVWNLKVDFDIDVAFINEYGKIQEIYTLKANDADITGSSYPAQFALEMQGGWFEERGIRPGVMVEGL